MRTLAFTPTSEVLANPGRGWFLPYDPDFATNDGAPPLDARDLAARAEAAGATVVSERHVLDDHRTSDLPQALLDEIEADLRAVEAAGLKMIPEVTYVWNLDIEDRDAPLAWTLRHVAQLEPIWEEHGHVVSHFQRAFIGRWGEMHTSTEGHVVPLTTRFSEGGEAILRAWLDATPEDRMVGVRYPDQMQALIDGPVGEGEAFTGTDAARLGFFNDGLFRDETDFGTFDPDPDERAAQRTFIEEATEFVVVSGEPAGRDEEDHVAGVDPVAALDRQNFDLLNLEQGDAIADGIYDDWRETGAFDDLARGLGYRFELREVALPEAVTPGGRLEMTLDVANTGFTRAYNARPLEVVLRGPDGAERALPTGVDARARGEDEVTTVALSLRLPDDLPAGPHEVLLALPDPAPELADDPRHAVRLANEGVWEAETGLNALGASVEVGAARIEGGAGDDRLRGTAADEVFATGGGRDRIVFAPGPAGSDAVTDFDVNGGGERGFDVLALRWGARRGRRRTRPRSCASPARWRATTRRAAPRSRGRTWCWRWAVAMRCAWRAWRTTWRRTRFRWPERPRPGGGASRAAAGGGACEGAAWAAAGPGMGARGAPAVVAPLGPRSPEPPRPAARRAQSSLAERPGDG